ncbi:MAG TPA: DUF6356 family protein [Steroidobacteraceae bacterium]|jgi:hypothetical protein|nr:DUF6356 family protein [Steroidobacteraceae bacterium]
MDIFRWFTTHPASVGESYGEHLVRATSFGGRMMLAGIACMLHGLLPFLFVRTGSRTVSELNDQLSTRRPAASASPALRVDLLNS